MAQHAADCHEQQRVEPAVQRRFDREPRGGSVGLQCVGEVTRECAITGSVDGERETGAVRVENTRRQLKMSGEKNGDC